MMRTKKVTIAATIFRLVLGWYMFIDGIEAVLTPGWSASGFLTNPQNAHMFYQPLYAWFALPMNSWWVNPLNMWGITLVGVALLLGVAIRPAAWAGATLVVLYYFPHYNTLPIVPHGFIIEDHLIDAAGFVLIALLPSAQTFGLAGYLRTKTFLGRIPVVRALL